MNYHQICLGRGLSSFETALRDRAVALNPSMDFLHWDDEQVESHRVALQLPRIYDLMPVEAKGDILRVCILAAEESWGGGVYADLDTVWLKPLDSLVSQNTAFVGRDAKLGVMNSVLCAPSGHPWMVAVREALTGFYYAKRNAPWWEQVSFPVVRAVLEAEGFEDVAVLEPNVLFPYGLAERRTNPVTIPDFANYGPETIGVHLYASAGDAKIAPLPEVEILAALPAI